MEIVRVAVGIGGGTAPIIVPYGAISILSVAPVGSYIDGSSADLPPRVYISADPNDTLAVIESGSSKSVLARAGTGFPNIPVSAGETLLVVISAQGSAVIYFESPS